MSEIQVRCTECNEVLSVDDSMNMALCRFCGEAFEVADAKKVYSMYNQAADIKVDFDIENGVLKGYKGSSSSIVIPAGVTKIGEKVFMFQDFVTSVLIPDSVRYIGAGAFGFCSNLETVIISNGVTNISYSAFSDCDKLKKIKIPDSVEVLEEGAFSDCKNLCDVTISKELLIKSKAAFSKNLYEKLMSDFE